MSAGDETNIMKSSINSPYPITDYNNIFKYLGRTDNPVSQGILIKNKKYSILSSESLMQKLKYDSINDKWISVDLFFHQKVFYDKAKKMIWCITGFDIYDEINIRIKNLTVNNLERLEKELKELQKYISRYLQEAQWCNDFLDVKILLSLSINNQIYNCLITCSSNSDMKFNQTVFLYDFPLSLSIGSYADQTKLMIDNPSEADNKSILLQRAENYISDIIQIDTQILKFGFPVVGGDIYSIVLDKNGNIETYINGINTNF